MSLFVDAKRKTPILLTSHGGKVTVVDPPLVITTVRHKVYTLDCARQLVWLTYVTVVDSRLLSQQLLCLTQGVNWS